MAILEFMLLSMYEGKIPSTSRGNCLLQDTVLSTKTRYCPSFVLKS